MPGPAPVYKQADEIFAHSFPLFYDPEGENQLPAETVLIEGKDELAR